MKLAVTIWGNRISPVFDAARTLLVADMENKRITRQFITTFNPDAMDDLIHTLKTFHVDILVCGAISKQPADLITSRNIHLISFVTGNARQFLESFAGCHTVEKKHMMPGCRRHYHKAY